MKSKIIKTLKFALSIYPIEDKIIECARALEKKDRLILEAIREIEKEEENEDDNQKTKEEERKEIKEIYNYIKKTKRLLINLMGIKNPSKETRQIINKIISRGYFFDKQYKKHYKENDDIVKKTYKLMDEINKEIGISQNNIDK